MSTLSSRSHTIVLLTLHRANSPSSTLTFVDLAGSERAMFTSALGLREVRVLHQSSARTELNNSAGWQYQQVLSLAEAVYDGTGI